MLEKEGEKKEVSFAARVVTRGPVLSFVELYSGLMPPGSASSVTTGLLLLGVPIADTSMA